MATECRYCSTLASPPIRHCLAARPSLSGRSVSHDLISLRGPDTWFNCTPIIEGQGVELGKQPRLREVVMNDHVPSVTQVAIRYIKCCGHNFPTSDSCRVPFVGPTPLEATVKLVRLVPVTRWSPHLWPPFAHFSLSGKGWEMSVENWGDPFNQRWQGEITDYLVFKDSNSHWSSHSKGSSLLI